MRYFRPYVCLPPPPRAMLESRIRSRGLAPGCCFSTLRGGAGGPSKSASLETGRNTAFGAFPVYVGATMISGFVATALIWPPWAPRAHRSLQEAWKSGNPDLGLGSSHFRARRFKVRPGRAVLTPEILVAPPVRPSPLILVPRSLN